MANTFIGINRGQPPINPLSFTVGASTGSTDIELRIDTGKGTLKMDVVKALEGMRAYLLSGATIGDTVYPGQ